jgi:hypothetical protein
MSSRQVKTARLANEVSDRGRTNSFARLTSAIIIAAHQLVRIVSSNRKVIEHIKLTWKIAANSENPFTHEIMQVFRFDHPTPIELSKGFVGNRRYCRF